MTLPLPIKVKVGSSSARPNLPNHFSSTPSHLVYSLVYPISSFVVMALLSAIGVFVLVLVLWQAYKEVSYRRRIPKGVRRLPGPKGEQTLSFRHLPSRV